MKFKIELKNHIIYTPQNNIIQVNINEIDFEELEMEIKEFNKEIKWDDMWSIETAKQRLQNNWKLIIYTPNKKIKGWYWLDDTNEPRNLYINKEYRNKGIGKEMHLVLLNICKNLGMEMVECHIDEWNVASQKCIKNAGWKEA